MSQEFGIILWPDAVFELLRIHNASFFPPDAKVTGFEIDARDSSIFIEVSSSEPMETGVVPMEDRGHLLKV